MKSFINFLSFLAALAVSIYYSIHYKMSYVDGFIIAVAMGALASILPKFFDQQND